MSGAVFKDIFEKQLKAKVMQKTNPKLTEEAYLVKSFKFFDTYNKGELSYQQFHQALEKIGIYYTF
jgi:Ca2+-binding EF-hand superfamily protein